MNLCAAVLALPLLLPQQQQDERYYVYTFWFGVIGSPDPAPFKPHMEEVKDRGFNAISFDVSWATEDKEGYYNWKNVDKMADLVHSLGMKMFIRINTSFHRYEPYWVTDDMRMRKEDGTVFKWQGQGWSNPSIHHPFVRAKKLRFYTEVANHFAKKYPRGRSGSPVVCFSACWNQTLESEYSFTDDLDYSNWSKKWFEKWIKDETRGRKIDEWNEAWGTQYKRTSDVELDNAPRALRDGFFSESLDELFSDLKKALRRGDRAAKLGVQFGCLWDNPPRHCTAVVLHNPDIDWIFVADAPGYPHDFTVDMIRGSAPGKMISNEIDGPHAKPKDDPCLSQGKTSWDHGASAVFVCNWPRADFNDPQFTFFKKLGKLAREPRTVPKVRRAVYCSTWDLLLGTGTPWPYRDHVKVEEGSGEAVDVLLDAALIAREKDLAGYEEIILPYNITIADDARAVLDKLPAAKLKILRPGEAGTKNEFGKSRPAITGK